MGRELIFVLSILITNHIYADCGGEHAKSTDNIPVKKVRVNTLITTCQDTLYQLSKNLKNHVWQERPPGLYSNRQVGQ